MHKYKGVSVKMNEQTQNVVTEEKDVEISAKIGAVVEETNLENCLKVKADPPDITPEDRKKNVKALAGAISHSLRAKGEINVRGFGNGAIGKAAKALAIARSYVKVQNLDIGQVIQIAMARKAQLARC